MLFDTPGLPPPTKIAVASSSNAGSGNGGNGVSKKRKRSGEQSNGQHKQQATHGAEINMDKLMKKMSKKQQQQGQDSGWGKPLGGRKGGAVSGSAGVAPRSRGHVYDEDSAQEDTPSSGPVGDGQRKRKLKQKSKGDMFAVGGGGIVQPVPGSAQSSRQNRHQTVQTPTKAQDGKRTGKAQKEQDAASAASTGSNGPPRRHSAPNHSAETQSPALSTGMQAALRAKLAGGKFRMLNETLYTSSGADAFETMRDEGNFDNYHAGFRSQAAHWPVQPLSLIVSHLRANLPSRALVADFGCGDAALARDLVSGSTDKNGDEKHFKVLSFDLLSKDGWVIEAECASGVPLPGTDSTKANPLGEGQIVDAVVCCLSLMGTDWIGMIREARRVLVQGGFLKVAEVSSRFTNIDEFVTLVESVGFKLVSKDTTNTHFVMFDFVKSTVGSNNELGKVKVVTNNTNRAETMLKPCIYKRR